MELVRRIQDRFGGRWVKVKFYGKVTPDHESNGFQGERFCEAVTQSYLGPLTVTAQKITCPGARYVFGWNGEITPEMTENLHRGLGFPLDQAKVIIEELPRLRPPCTAIGLNQMGDPDILISYCQPEQMMEIVRTYQQKTQKSLTTQVSSAASICANIALTTFLDRGINFSFGCPNARRYGKIGRDRLAVGISLELAGLLIE
jgi:uncharacterized protein (DUF169 family)